MKREGEAQNFSSVCIVDKLRPRIKCRHLADESMSLVLSQFATIWVFLKPRYAQGFW